MKVEIGSYHDFCSFMAHFEGDELLIDECEGVSPQEALSLFPDWAIEAAKHG